MRPILSLLVLAGLSGLAGCGLPDPPPAETTTTSAAALPKPVDTSSLPKFDNLDYANWKQFPIGAMVKRKSVATSENSTASTTSIETLTLVEANDREVVVERRNVTERSDNSFRSEHPAEKWRYARQFPIPKGMTAEDFSKPSRGAKVAGEEELSILGKEYKTISYTWTDSTEAGPMEVQIWLSDEIPGRIARQVMKVPSLGNTTIDEVIEIQIP